MKRLTDIQIVPNKYLAIAALFLYQTLSWAQETKEVDVNLSVDDGSTTWYAEPWVWVVGGAIFIIILVALMRGGDGKD